jgi:hypothetical protein
MNSWPTLTIIIPLLFLIQVVLVYALFKLSAELKQHRQQLKELKNEQQAIISGSLGLGRKLFQVKNNLSLLERHQLELQQTATSESGIEQASKLLRKGISIDEVVETCHISRGEAELLQQMLASSALH